MFWPIFRFLAQRLKLRWNWSAAVCCTDALLNPRFTAPKLTAVVRRSRILVSGLKTFSPTLAQILGSPWPCFDQVCCDAGIRLNHDFSAPKSLIVGRRSWFLVSGLKMVLAKFSPIFSLLGPCFAYKFLSWEFRGVRLRNLGFHFRWVKMHPLDFSNGSLIQICFLGIVPCPNQPFFNWFLAKSIILKVRRIKVMIFMSHLWYLYGRPPVSNCHLSLGPSPGSETLVRNSGYPTKKNPINSWSRKRVNM